MRQQPSTNLAEPPAAGAPFRTDIPARLDRLPWCRWHWLVVVALGITWVIDGLEVTLDAWLFDTARLGAGGQTALWAALFFFASAAASAAYLTVSEIFPLEMRGLVIALFYAVGTGLGGPLASWLFGYLVGTGSRRLLSYGDLLAAGLLLATAAVVAAFGVKAERASLEQIARPLSAAESYAEADGAAQIPIPDASVLATCQRARFRVTCDSGSQDQVPPPGALL